MKLKKQKMKKLEKLERASQTIHQGKSNKCSWVYFGGDFPVFPANKSKNTVKVYEINFVYEIKLYI